MKQRSAAAVSDEFRTTATLACTAGTLLLTEPDHRLLRCLLETTDFQVGTLETLRQAFYDRLCMPQSGLYVPPFEHVFRGGRKANGVWHFPPARADGALEVEAIYREQGFRHTTLNVAPLFRSAHLPGDHIGFMLIFLGWMLRSRTGYDTALCSLLGRFVARHLDGWIEPFGERLCAGDTTGYLTAVAAAVSESAAELRRRLPPIRSQARQRTKAGIGTGG